MALKNPSIPTSQIIDSSEEDRPKGFPQYHYENNGIRVQVSQKSFLDGIFTNIHRARVGYQHYQGKLVEARNAKKQKA